MAKKFVLNEKTITTLGFVIIVVMLLSAMRCGKKENATFLYNRQMPQHYAAVGGEFVTASGDGQCMGKCAEDPNCNSFTWFNKGGFSQDPTKRCKKFNRASMRDNWPTWAYSQRKVPGTNEHVERYHGMWIPDAQSNISKAMINNRYIKNGWNIEQEWR